MFIFRVGVVLQELHAHAPEIITPLEAKGTAAYPQVPKTSIDYALMEKTQLAYVLPGDFGWDDLGDWNAIERLLKGDAQNVELANHVGLDTQGCIFYATDAAEVILTIGLEDVVVVRDRNVTLVVKKDRTQEIKQALKFLRNTPVGAPIVRTNSEQGVAGFLKKRGIYRRFKYLPVTSSLLHTTFYVLG
jgi:mannose-1-phosphate guanylyltransferase